MERVSSLQIEPIADGPNGAARSQVRYGGRLGPVLGGAVLEAALGWRNFLLVFLTQDIPQEDSLDITLLGPDLALLDRAVLAMPYATGRFALEPLEPGPIVRFRFFNPETIVFTLTCLPSPNRGLTLPLISEPRGVWRPDWTQRHFRISRLTHERPKGAFGSQP
ncbi:MAG: hypothetical protein ACFB2Z_03720 [Maricaulaceae bacterium]